ncbi:unnamed protein product [Paramecium sonneborni]|uniref:Uncharacterized protein n=1 Tax=Paramecium sonneborni TaxID=65129 RepID=A0A8S1Q035_9CILI|nr:unnamed protein product [Paramecium sonneborni]CAD8108651.1 unnamed protein product [Paramecium sonneborni]
MILMRVYLNILIAAESQFNTGFKKTCNKDIFRMARNKACQDTANNKQFAENLSI